MRSGTSWKTTVEQQRNQMSIIEIPADATLTQLGNMLAQFGSNCANAEYEVRVAEAYWLELKAKSDEWLLLETAKFEDKKMTETAKRAQVLLRNPDLREALYAADKANYELSIKRGERDRWKMAFEATSRIVAVRQMQHDLERRSG